MTHVPWDAPRGWPGPAESAPNPNPHYYDRMLSGSCFLLEAAAPDYQGGSWADDRAWFKKHPGRDQYERAPSTAEQYSYAFPPGTFITVLQEASGLLMRFVTLPNPTPEVRHG